mgnify:FL=1
MASFDDDTIAALRAKHPSRAQSAAGPPPPPPKNSLQGLMELTEANVVEAIKTFPPGSAGGLDGLRPQRLKDMISTETGQAGQRLVYHLTRFVNLCLAGRVPTAVRPVFCGASLCALSKKDGGIRPIAVGCTLRRLVAKAACRAVKSKMAALLAPVQLGFGIKHGIEAAVHAGRLYLQNVQRGQAMLKLDFSNAFNT